MARRPGRSGREVVHPHREKLLELRDKYMRDMDAPSYSVVREKFIQEVQSKRAPGEAPQKEWGVGVWNNAFASSGVMQRSSLVLLAEFFGVEPDALILPSEPPVAEAPPEGSAPAATQSISISGQHNQVAAATGNLIIHGSITQTGTPTQSEDVS